MSEYPDFLKPSMCAGKKKFGNQTAAEGSIQSMKLRGLLARTEAMNAYKCPFCNFFHIGHKANP